MIQSPLVFSIAAVLLTGMGGWFVLHLRKWTERHLWRLLAFGSGVILSVTFLHLLPEAWEVSPRWAGGAMLAAMISLFIAEEFTVVHACGEVAFDCHVHHVGVGAMMALFFHGLTDGLAIAFSFLSSEHLGHVVSGAVLAHKFVDGMTLSSLFLAGGRPVRHVALLTGALSLATPLGVAVGFAAGPWVHGVALAVMLGLAGGGFIYVGMADVLPRIHKMRDTWCWVFLVVGAVSGLALAGH